ncbi:MAG: winged helix DNA-binding domain-containing protein [Actinomycetota bacterium]
MQKTMPKVTWRKVMAWRVRRHHLDKRVPRKRALEVASRVCCLHAQIMSSAELSMWTRVGNLKADDVAHWLWSDRSLVKTWAMRGTLHLIPADEYPTWQVALNTLRHYRRDSWLRAFGVTHEEFDRLMVAISEALDGEPLTRDQLATRVGEITGSAVLGDRLRESWGALLKPASFQGKLCFAPNEGRNVRFTRPDRWLKLADDPLDLPEAQASITRRFLAAYGPATLEDYARWCGITPANAGKLIAALGEEVTEVDVEATPAWLLADDVDELRSAKPVRSVRLLPAFDPYVIGSTRHVVNLMPGDHKALVHRAQGWVSPVMLVNGRMDGVWRLQRKGRRLLIEIEPFVKIPKWARQEAEREAELLAGFGGGGLELTWVT